MISYKYSLSKSCIVKKFHHIINTTRANNTVRRQWCSIWLRNLHTLINQFSNPWPFTPSHDLRAKPRKKKKKKTEQNILDHKVLFSISHVVNDPQTRTGLAI